ncbi:MAG TPA: hypothetical protein VNJ48_10230 [Nocardioides sp.]|nr:hypothetical protein [Nocardioides sp.]HXH78871.1 hypothetical protein [Nocardioides sp.]
MEKEACWSLLLVAATVMAAGTRAGEVLQASAASFPAATTAVIPSSITALSAASTVELALPPRLRFITAWVPAA